MEENELSHTDDQGRARMVDVSRKPDVTRLAHAEGFIQLSPFTINLIRKNELKKGNVLATAELAGIQAAKCTAQLIPLCHPLLLTSIQVNTQIDNEGIRIKSVVKNNGPTGVEMEALTAVSVALLTVYDMCKAVDKNMVIGPVKLIEKKKSASHGEGNKGRIG